MSNPRIVQIAVAAPGIHSKPYVYALDDLNRVWCYTHDQNHWTLLPDLPDEYPKEQLPND
jgi:hypothetical protein